MLVIRNPSSCNDKGNIRAENNEAGEASFYIKLPIEKRAVA